MDDQELKAQLDEIAPPAAPTEKTDADVLEQLKRTDPQPYVAPPVPETGKLVVEYKTSVIKRDDFGRIVAVITGTETKTVERDEHGRIVQVVTQTEREENNSSQGG